MESVSVVMRRARNKQDTYIRLLGSPMLGLSRAKSSHRDSPVIPHKRYRSENFLRFGSPAETLVHVPLHVGRVSGRASGDLTRRHYKLEQLIRSQQPSPNPLDHKKRDLLTAIKSVSVPVNNFDNVSRSRMAFCITPSDVPESERIRVDIMQRVRSERDLEGSEKVTEAALKSKENVLKSSLKIKGFEGNGLEAAHVHSSKHTSHKPVTATFLEAVKSSDHNQVRHLLSQTPSLVNITDSVGQTALHWAAKRNDLTMARILKAAGADVNAMDMTLRTPLYIAARKDWAGMVTLLLESGADTSLTSLNGSSPFDVAKTGSMTWTLIRRKTNNAAVSIFLGGMKSMAKPTPFSSAIFRRF